VRDYNTLGHVGKALELTHTGKKDLVIMTVHLQRGPNMGYKDIEERHIFTDYEQLLFSRVVSLAEKAGKRVHLLVVPSSSIFQAIAQTAAQLESSEIIAGRSSVMTPAEQAKRMGEAWEQLPRKPECQVCFRVIDPSGEIQDFCLGAHAPRLTEREIDLIHRLWLDMTHGVGGHDLHHKDVVTIALSRLDRDLKGLKRTEVLTEARTDTHKEHELVVSEQANRK